MTLNQEELTRISMNRAMEKAREIYRLSRGREVIRSNELITLRKKQKAKLEKFGDVKSHNTSDVEYSVVLEKFNLEIAEKQKEIQYLTCYKDRAEAFYNLAFSILQKSEVAVQKSVGKLLDTIEQEIMSNYKSNITILRQKKAVANRQNAYLRAIRKKYPEEYDLKIKTVPTAMEIDDMDIKQYDLEKEKEAVGNFFEKKEFKLNQDAITNMTLLDENIFTSANSIYPGLEEVRLGKKSKNTKKDKSSKATK